MGLWTGIKYALNSTLGTKDFQPLDEIIKGQRTYGPSDDVLVLLGPSTPVFVEYDEPEKVIPNIQFKALVNGTVRVKCFAEIQGAGLNGRAVTAYFRVRKDGNTYLSSSATNPNYDQLSEEIIIDCPIEKGSVYTFSASTSNGNAGFGHITICGQIVDLSMIEYTTNM
jgi:hypothetical protein